MSKPSKHVVPSSSGGWVVRNSGSARALRSFETREQAIGFGRSAARRAGTELYIHGRDGTIKDKQSYGKDLRLNGIERHQQTERIKTAN